MVSSSLTGLHGEMEQALLGPSAGSGSLEPSPGKPHLDCFCEVSNGSRQLYSKMFERPVLKFKFILILTQ